MHSSDIALVLESLRERLAQQGVPFAVIGALALRYYGYSRHTEEFAILTTPDGLREAFADRIAPTLREKFLDLLRESRLERDLE
jgi:hypothetical protein